MPLHIIEEKGAIIMGMILIFSFGFFSILQQ